MASMGKKYEKTVVLDSFQPHGRWVFEIRKHKFSLDYNYKLTKKFELISGPLTNLIFNVVEENKKFVESYIGNYKVTVSKEENLFRPV